MNRGDYVSKRWWSQRDALYTNGFMRHPSMSEAFIRMRGSDKLVLNRYVGVPPWMVCCARPSVSSGSCVTPSKGFFVNPSSDAVRGYVVYPGYTSVGNRYSLGCLLKLKHVATIKIKEKHPYDQGKLQDLHDPGFP